MRNTGVRRQFGAAQVAVGLSIVAMSIALAAQPVSARDLRNFIQDLYGGDGVTLDSSAGHDAHFTADSLVRLGTLGNAISAGIQAQSTSGAVAAVVFDLERGVPVKRTDSLGPILADRADTIGENRISLGLFYSRTEFKKFNGQRLDRLVVNLPHVDTPPSGGGNPPFENDLVRLDVNARVIREAATFTSTYGVTDRWDLYTAIPLVKVRARASSVGSIIDQGGSGIHLFGDGDPAVSSSGGTEEGLGDIIVGTKYNFVRGHEFWPDFSVPFQVRLPTGNEKDLLGSGQTAALVGAIFSKRFGRFTPHLNAAYEADFDGPLNDDNIRIAIGTELVASPDVTLVADLLGRFFTNDGKGRQLLDASFGVKWNVFEFPVTANILIPINKNDNLRPDFALLFGIERTF